MKTKNRNEMSWFYCRIHKKPFLAAREKECPGCNRQPDLEGQIYFEKMREGLFKALIQAGAVEVIR